ncbi:inner ear-specific collagen-like [Dicentrarchus labrax]|uniref:inner ear-specific collagen-like n=1 Tax=Dicentrarchus labrax TaxID=13489 RepID=UPI0021F66D45|nr:inner ear-specific collagen-like [Dicentrarchus labrax]
MRAIILLCLLHAAFGQPHYDWNGPGHGDRVTDPNANSACQTDQGSCGCCLMLRSMNSLRSYFNTSLNELEKVHSQTEQSLNNIKASRTAFSVSLYSDDRFKCFGNFAGNRPVIYSHVFINLGAAYNTNTGIFTVPRSGVYSLAVTLYSDAGAPGNTLAICAALQVNGNVVAASRDQNKNDQEDSSSILVVLHLKAGDQVYVNLFSGCFLCDDNSHFNTFSAFLLYLTE